MRFSIFTLLFFSFLTAAYGQDASSAYLAKSGTAVNAVAWSKNGEYFATSWNNTTILWEAATNTIAGIYSNSPDDTINPLTDIMALEFGPDTKTLLSVHNTNTAMIHSIGDSQSALFTGTGPNIPDAVYVGRNFRMILPLDEKNLYECVFSQTSAQYEIEKRMELNKRIVALTSSGSSGYVFVTFDDGTADLIDTNTWENLGSIEIYTMSELYPEFSPDGKHYISALDQNHLLISSISNPNEQYIIEDEGSFSFTAQFSADGNKIIAGTPFGFVKYYDMVTGAEENSFQLVEGDVAKSIAVSPDGEFILIGTRKGYIYRWSLHGFEFDKDEKKYVDEEGNEFDPDKYKDGIKIIPDDSFLINFELGGSASNYYNLAQNISVGYRNYSKIAKHSMAFGFNGGFGRATPNGDFPFTYTYNEKSLGGPTIYSIFASGSFGLFYYNTKHEFTIFSELSAGTAGRILFNNSFRSPHSSRFYPSVFGNVSVGASWRWLRATFGVTYDSNLRFTLGGTMGVAIPTDVLFKNRGKKIKIDEEPSEEENFDEAFETSEYDEGYASEDSGYEYGSEEESEDENPADDLTEETGESDSDE